MTDEQKEIEVVETEMDTLKPMAYEFVVRNPETGKPTGMVFTLVATSTPKVEAAKRAILDARLQDHRRKLNANIHDANGLNLIVAAVDGWKFEYIEEGVKYVAKWNGKQPEFSERELRAFMKDPMKRWVRNKLDEELNEEGNFFKSLPKA